MSPFDPLWQDFSPPGGVYEDPVWAAALSAIDPAGLGGLVLRTWSGPSRETYLQNLVALRPPGTPVRKLPLGISEDRLSGGIDVFSTLGAGRIVYTNGLLADARGGVLILAMAERIAAETAARLAAAIDAGGGFAVVALDESAGPDEAPSAALAERLAFSIADLPGPDAVWPSLAQIQQADIAAVETSQSDVTECCALAAMLGISSLRAPLFMLRAARAAAALRGAGSLGAEDLALAARLVLAPRATQIPAAQDMAPEPENAAETKPAETPETLEESVAEAAQARLPAELLAALAAAGPRRLARGAGTAGVTASLKRGRPAGTRRGALGGDARLSLIETLRAAAPWQALRRQPGRKLVIRRDDIRIKKFKEQARSIAIFAVDASGSSALNRLAEAKGAIQLLLADCYVRRDQVALIAFRGKAAETLLPPTAALARARRALASLPGGGPTPLAAGIAAAHRLAEAERRAGKLPLLVLLTDGGANIGSSGQPGRAAAAADALTAAKACRAAGLAALVVDTAPRPQATVAKLAAAMGGKYLALPYADPGRLSQAVQAHVRH